MKSMWKIPRVIGVCISAVAFDVFYSIYDSSSSEMKACHYINLFGWF